MKNIIDKIFSLNALAFLGVMFIVLSLVLLFTPVQDTLFGGLLLFAAMCALVMWAYKKYNAGK